MVPKMEQRIGYNVYNEPRPLYDVTDENGYVATFTNHQDAYETFVFLFDHYEMSIGRPADQEAELKRQRLIDHDASGELADCPW